MRADKFFSARFSSRTRAKEALAAGRVLLNGKPLAPDDEIVSEEGVVILEGENYASAGAKKLERALSRFPVAVEGQIFADLGASTGGFTDVLLRHGAAHVFSVDVGKGQLDARLAGDARVTVMDGVNARYLTRESFPVPLGGVVSDLSFISLRLVLPAVAELLGSGRPALVLFKPQFECGGKGLTKSGILPRVHHLPLLADFYDFYLALGLSPKDIVNAPAVPKKNIEYIVWLERDGQALPRDGFLRHAAQFFA